MLDCAPSVNQLLERKSFAVVCLEVVFPLVSSPVVLLVEVIVPATSANPGIITAFQRGVNPLRDITVSPRHQAAGGHTSL